MSRGPDAAPAWWAQVGLIVRKDLRLERRDRARSNATLLFALLVLLLFSFAVGPQARLLTRLAPGFLWLAILLSNLLNLGESMRQESEHGVADALRLWGIDSSALFVGKALGSTLLQLGLAALLLPLALALYDVAPVGRPSTLVVSLLLGTSAIAAPGTLFAAMAAHSRARDVLLPLLLFPVLVPGLLAAVRTTAAALQGDPMGELPSWLALLAVFNLVYWTLCPVLFDKVIEC